MYVLQSVLSVHAQKQLTEFIGVLLSTFNGGKMNKSELIQDVAENAAISKATAAKAVDGVLDSIKDALADGDTVTLIGFGTFSVRERAARKGRNPRTGEPLDIGAANVPVFKAGKSLKDAVNA
jgi:DNA-binding protein HU-beta